MENVSSSGLAPEAMRSRDSTTEAGAGFLSARFAFAFSPLTHHAYVPVVFPSVPVTFTGGRCTSDPAAGSVPSVPVENSFSEVAVLTTEGGLVASGTLVDGVDSSQPMKRPAEPDPAEGSCLLA